MRCHPAVHHLSYRLPGVRQCRVTAMYVWITQLTATCAAPCCRVVSDPLSLKWLVRRLWVSNASCRNLQHRSY